MRVRLFAALRELAGTARLDVDAPDVGSLLDHLSEQLGPEFQRIMRAGTVVVDGETVGRDRALNPEDDVALLPPVSGGTILRDPAQRNEERDRR
jgi:MoaD family protein